MTISQYFRLMDAQARLLLKIDASKFKLGFLWWFLEPLLWVLVFYVVFNMILDSGKRSGDFVLFLACGKLAFIWFSKTVTQASMSVIQNQGLVGKINVPKSLFPLSSLQESLYRQASVYILLGVILAFAGIYPEVRWFWMIPVIFVNYLLIAAFGLLGAYLVCCLRDVQKIIPLGMTFLMFTSGVFWDIRELGSQDKTDFLLAVNPLAFLLDANRQVLMYGGVPDLVHLGVIGICSALMVVLAMFLMHRYSQFLALRVLT